jgi:hypothetical protein
MGGMLGLFFFGIFTGWKIGFFGLLEPVFCTNYKGFVHRLLRPTLGLPAFYLSIFSTVIVETFRWWHHFFVTTELGFPYSYFHQHFGDFWLVAPLFCDYRTRVSISVFSVTFWGLLVGDITFFGLLK